MRRFSICLCTLALVAVACGGGHRQSPLGSDEALGRTRGAEEAEASSYVTAAGDTLRSIAARPEIYGDAELWPVLQEANPKTLGSFSPQQRLPEGKVLAIPRSLTADQMEEAREKARQYVAAMKAARHPKTPEPEKEPNAVPTPSPQKTAAAPVALPPQPEPPRPVPPPKSSGGMGSILLLLLLVLAALGAVLYVFYRKDRQDQA